jgi:hypothetical protein
MVKLPDYPDYSLMLKRGCVITNGDLTFPCSVLRAETLIDGEYASVAIPVPGDAECSWAPVLWCGEEVHDTILDTFEGVKRDRDAVAQEFAA